MGKITEVIPDNLPEWAEEAMKAGKLFQTMLGKAEGLELCRDIADNILQAGTMPLPAEVHVIGMKQAFREIQEIANGVRR